MSWQLLLLQVCCCIVGHPGSLIASSLCYCAFALACLFQRAHNSNRIGCLSGLSQHDMPAVQLCNSTDHSLVLPPCCLAAAVPLLPAGNCIVLLPPFCSFNNQHLNPSLHPNQLVQNMWHRSGLVLLLLVPLAAATWYHEPGSDAYPGINANQFGSSVCGSSQMKCKDGCKVSELSQFNLAAGGHCCILLRQ